MNTRHTPPTHWRLRRGVISSHHGCLLTPVGLAYSAVASHVFILCALCWTVLPLIPARLRSPLLLGVQCLYFLLSVVFFSCEPCTGRRSAKLQPLNLRYTELSTLYLSTHNKSPTIHCQISRMNRLRRGLCHRPQPGARWGF